MSKKVLLIVGSLRERSFNRTVAEYILKKLEEKGVETVFLDYSKLPFINQDIEFPAPNEVDKIRNEVKNVDALWIVTPEYNGSVPGPLKNFLDWISRPVEKGNFGAPEFVKGKLVAVSGVAGRSEASLVIAEISGLLTRMGLNLLEEKVGLALPTEAFQTGVFNLSDEQKSKLDNEVKLFVEKL
ncbi:NADPH-dependent FMN reductase [Fusobacterium canifelinum]|uniref:NAD(P)H-dependent oxidoreductase n=1 Tax=Fusobacterium canifelinum TaxID=285729 RepID=A0A3P1UUE4_9FUSO|nr:NADPH-dependent FMN reductase [Fusobacterium canifelinum]QQS87292.1 NAD(P)H-dependent oxidoreductase [Fusobacterium canifelinum]RRD25564.1 NAD(P)H-dependent oxidoreductase [Fusobacterium canifelinum]